MPSWAGSDSVFEHRRVDFIPMRTKFLPALAALTLLLGSLRPAAAQWQTQSILVKPGWTAIYLHVDPSYTTLDALIGGNPGNPISEVWLWVPTVSTLQYVTSPQAPLAGSSQWATWVRGGTNTASSLGSLIPNAAYLIHSLAATNYTWTVKGKPTAPNYTWTTTGINLLGFPIVSSSPPAFDSFLSLVPAFQSVADIYQYPGGELGPLNPVQVFAPHGVPVTRGQAFWIRSSSYFNNYFGPFQVGVDRGVDFGDSTSRNSFHLRNTTPFPVTIQLRLMPSEAPPAGQAPIVGVPPLVVRGALVVSNLTYIASSLTPSTSLSWTLPPQGQSGSDIVLLLGVDRVAFANSAPGVYAGILKFTDSYNYTEVDVRVSAQPATYAGLWVGSAAVTQVGNYLKTYQRNASNGLVQNPNGAYVVASLQTNLGPTAASFPLRLILHNTGTQVKLLQRVFYGSDVYSNILVTTSESRLDPARLGNARRISAVQFPWTPNNDTWAFVGQLQPGATLTADVPLAYTDQADNPFLHTFHPDHDNLDRTVTPPRQLAQGLESYGLSRHITLTLNTVGADFDSLTQFGQTFQGAYSETMQLAGIGGATRTFNVTGAFALNRISPIAVLTGP